MSKANGAIEKKNTFLQHVSLKNYKSIKDVEIEFKPGLNIIIGKNASGKTNFVNGLNTILNFRYDDLIDSESIIKAVIRDNEIEIKALNRSQTQEDITENDYDKLINHEMKLKINNKRVKVSDYDEVKDELFDNSYYLNGLLIRYGIRYRNTTQFINVPFTFTFINNGNISRELMTVTKNDNRTEFLQFFFSRLYINILKLYRLKKNKKEIPEFDLKEEIIAFSEEHLKKINDVISNYSPIQKIRINPDFNVIKEDDQQKQIVTNLCLEFSVDQNWLVFNLLSDGTKRLFYIISEMLTVYPNNQALIFNGDLSLLLLEEPELGIHPHQLHQLMQFIKEQSREKQIILTTHSPQVLDILGPDELDRIIICHSDSKNGTQLNHLTEKEINKAKNYMKEEAFLSDYWRFSDLEPA